MARKLTEKRKKVVHNLKVMMYTIAVLICITYFIIFVWALITLTKSLVRIPNDEFSLKLFFLFGLAYILIGIGIKWTHEISGGLTEELIKVMKE